MSIYRVQLPVTDYQVAPINGAIISAAADRGGNSDVIDVWFETHFVEAAAVYIFGTGHPTPWTTATRSQWRFIDTVVTPSGLVWHVYVGPFKGQAAQQ